MPVARLLSNLGQLVKVMVPVPVDPEGFSTFRTPPSLKALLKVTYVLSAVRVTEFTE